MAWSANPAIGINGYRMVINATVHITAGPWEQFPSVLQRYGTGFPEGLLFFLSPQKYLWFDAAPRHPHDKLFSELSHRLRSRSSAACLFCWRTRSACALAASACWLA
jgi:hypothetical protein